MAVIPRGPRASIESLGDSMIITLPSRKNWYQIISYCLFLLSSFDLISEYGGPWLDIPAFLAEFVIHPINWFFLTLYILIICILCWQIFGQEEIRVSTRAIICSNMLFGIRYPRESFALHIKNLRLSQNLNTARSSFFTYKSGQKGGWIAYDYGADTITFLNNVTEVEATEILSEIVKQFPQYQTHSKDLNTGMERKSSPLANGVPTDLWNNKKADYYEFLCDNPLRFEKLRTVFNALRDAKKHNSMSLDEIWLEYFDKDALSHFWWPTEKELINFKQPRDETPVHLCLTEPSLQKPWMLDSMIKSILVGEYELVNCYFLTDTHCRLEFIPNDGLNSDSDALKVLIECFGFKITAEDIS
jgi:hypothetical protein